MTKPKKKIKPVKAWAVLDDKGEILDVLYYKPTRYSHFQIGSWTFPVEGNEVIPILITPITKPSKH